MPHHRRMSRKTLAPTRARLLLAVAAVAVAGLSITTHALADVSGDVEADSVQSGENTYNGGQDSSIGGGDAAAGSNIVGSAGQGDTTIDVDNDSDGAVAESGDLELNSEISNVHVGEKTEAGDDPVDATTPESGSTEAIGPLGQLGPGEAETSTGGPNDPATGESIDPNEGVAPAELGTAEPLGALAVAAEIPAGGPAVADRNVLGQLTGPPGPTGPLDLPNTAAPAQIVPTLPPSTPAPATPAPQSEVESEGRDGLPLNGANIQTMATMATLLTGAGLLLSAISRVARIRRLAADLIAP